MERVEPVQFRADDVVGTSRRGAPSFSCIPPMTRLRRRAAIAVRKGRPPASSSITGTSIPARQEMAAHEVESSRVAREVFPSLGRECGCSFGHGTTAPALHGFAADLLRAGGFTADQAQHTLQCCVGQSRAPIRTACFEFLVMRLQLGLITRRRPPRFGTGAVAVLDAKIARSGAVACTSPRDASNFRILWHCLVPVPPSPCRCDRILLQQSLKRVASALP